MHLLPHGNGVEPSGIQRLLGLRGVNLTRSSPELRSDTYQPPDPTVSTRFLSSGPEETQPSLSVKPSSILIQCVPSRQSAVAALPQLQSSPTPWLRTYQRP